MVVSVKDPTKHVGVVQRGHHLIECNLFSRWHCR